MKKQIIKAIEEQLSNIEYDEASAKKSVADFLNKKSHFNGYKKMNKQFRVNRSLASSDDILQIIIKKVVNEILTYQAINSGEAVLFWGTRMIDKNVIYQYSKDKWFDPFRGWNDSFLTAIKQGSSYSSFDINEKMYEHTKSFLEPEILKNKPEAKFDNRLHDSRVFLPEFENKFNYVYTSPPYFSRELYTEFYENEIKQMTEDDFYEEYMLPIFENMFKYLKDESYVSLQTESDESIISKWIRTMEKSGFKLVEVRKFKTQSISTYSKNKEVEEIGMTW